MGDRIELQRLLESILESRNVYFQPPENYRLSYPCIIYKETPWKTVFADNKPYTWFTKYEITLIHEDPDNSVKNDLRKIPQINVDQIFVNDNLYHYVYTLYF